MRPVGPMSSERGDGGGTRPGGLGTAVSPMAVGWPKVVGVGWAIGGTWAAVVVSGPTGPSGPREGWGPPRTEVWEMLEELAEAVAEAEAEVEAEVEAPPGAWPPSAGAEVTFNGRWLGPCSGTP